MNDREPGSGESPTQRLLMRAQEHRMSYERTGDLRLLRLATTLTLSAVNRATDDVQRGHALANYAANLHFLMHLTSRRLMLGVAERRYAQAYALLADDHSARAVVLGNLLAIARQRYQETKDVRVLTAAIDRVQSYLAGPDIPAQRRVMLLYQLGVLWRFRAQGEDRIAHLHRAISLLLRANRDNGEERFVAAIANALSAALADHFNYTHRLSSIDRAIEVLRGAADALLPNDPDRVMLASNLATYLGERLEAAFAPEDLDEAVAWARVAVDLGRDSRDAAQFHLTLGNLLMLRFRGAGVLGDLREAIGELNTGVNAAPSPEAAATVLNALSTAHDLLARTTGVVADRRASLEFARTAVAHESRRAATYRTRINNLCRALATEATVRGSQALIDEAVVRHQTVLAAAPDGFTAMTDLWLAGASLLLDRSRVVGRAADAVAAARMCRQVLAEVGQDTDLFVQAHAVLARSMTQWRHLAPDRVLDGATRRSWRAASRISSARDPRRGFDVAVQWLRHAVAAEWWEDGVDAARAAVASLDALVRAQTTRTEQQAWLRVGADLAALAAESALACGRPRLAVELANSAHARLLALVSEVGPVTDEGEGLRQCAATEPIVLLCPGQRGGTAVVVRAAGAATRVETITLPGLTSAAVEAQMTKLDERLRAEGLAERRLRDLHVGLQVYGKWAGEHIFRPVTRGLPETSFSLLALGALGGLPHAAAWWFAPEAGDFVVLHQRARVRLLPRVDPRYAPGGSPGVDDGLSVITLSGSPMRNRYRPADLMTAETALLRSWTRHRTMRLMDDDHHLVRKEPGADVLHAAGHSTLDTSGAEGTLRVPGGATLTLRRIQEVLARRLAAVPELVLWSSCQSAGRDVLLPGEHLGLAGLALEMRARRVVATTVPVPDDSAFLFASRFVQQLGLGTPPAEAWHQAVTWLASSLPDAIVAWLGEIGDELDDANAAVVAALRDRISRLADDQPPYGSPVYWASLCYLGAP
ncbi:CHAT domain-containing protein [Lentzea sp. NPDC058436]|uniref:CHAT domain-containing protein n=1 Tax=Lentzea sp. NPDC058436 TaxID=3346499 RepID=UPI003659E590